MKKIKFCERKLFLALVCQEKMNGSSKKMELHSIQYAVRDNKLTTYADLSFKKC